MTERMTDVVKASRNRMAIADTGALRHTADALRARFAEERVLAPALARLGAETLSTLARSAAKLGSSSGQSAPLPSAKWLEGWLFEAILARLPPSAAKAAPRALAEWREVVGEGVPTQTIERAMAGGASLDAVRSFLGGRSLPDVAKAFVGFDLSQARAVFDAAARTGGLELGAIQGARAEMLKRKFGLELVRPEEPPPRALLVGSTGTGKSALVREVAERLGLELRDLDR